MPSARPDLASTSSRVVAYAFDAVIVGLAYVFVEYAGVSDRARFDSPAIYALLFFAYQLAFLQWNDGTSFGKSLRSICVIADAGTKITPNQAFARAALLAVPFALFSAQAPLAALLSFYPDAQFLALLPGVLWLLVELFLVESGPVPRSLTDRLARSLVVNIPPPQPHRAPAVPMYSATDGEFGPQPKRKPPAREDGAA
jgi:RDD family